MSKARGDNVAAAGYYRIFLNLAGPDNPQVKVVEKELADLEGGAQ